MSETPFNILPYDPQESDKIEESSGDKFVCPENTVMTGRWHDGDENGKTQYQYSRLIPAANAVSVEATSICGAIKESSDEKFECPEDMVMTGRMHDGDENGTTYYQFSYLTYNGEPLTTADAQWTSWKKESDGDRIETPENTVLTGREHKGDENGDTRYQYSKVMLGDTRMIVTNRRWSDKIKESSGTWFSCQGNAVLTGRKHKGDENGDTEYQAADVFFPDAPEITTGDAEWSDWLKESDDKYVAPENRVITGRQHKGDENGDTRYRTSKIFYDGQQGQVLERSWGARQKESSDDWYLCPSMQAMTGREHDGDENGKTKYQSGFLSVVLPE